MYSIYWLFDLCFTPNQHKESQRICETSLARRPLGRVANRPPDLLHWLILGCWLLLAISIIPRRYCKSSSIFYQTKGCSGATTCTRAFSRGFRWLIAAEGNVSRWKSVSGMSGFVLIKLDSLFPTVPLQCFWYVMFAKLREVPHARMLARLVWLLFPAKNFTRLPWFYPIVPVEGAVVLYFLGSSSRSWRLLHEQSNFFSNLLPDFQSPIWNVHTYNTVPYSYPPSFSPIPFKRCLLDVSWHDMAQQFWWTALHALLYLAMKSLD